MKEEKSENLILKNQKVCKWTIGANSLILLGLIWATIKYWQLGTDDLDGSTKAIAIGVGVAMICFVLLTAFALQGFLKNNKLTKIYFLLVCVFSFPFAMGYGEIGFFVMIFILIALFLNVSCYRKMHPTK